MLGGGKMCESVEKKKKRNIGDAERNREIKKYNVMLL